MASEVVAVLDLLGTASGVDHTVLGLTILAWGNSLGDLSTNIAMARSASVPINISLESSVPPYCCLQSVLMNLSGNDEFD